MVNLSLIWGVITARFCPLINTRRVTDHRTSDPLQSFQFRSTFSLQAAAERTNCAKRSAVEVNRKPPKSTTLPLNPQKTERASGGDASLPRRGGIFGMFFLYWLRGNRSCSPSLLECRGQKKQNKKKIVKVEFDCFHALQSSFLLTLFFTNWFKKLRETFSPEPITRTSVALGPERVEGRRVDGWTQLKVDRSDHYAVESSTPLSQTPLSIRVSTFSSWTRVHRSSPANTNAAQWLVVMWLGSRCYVHVMCACSPLIALVAGASSLSCSASSRTLSALHSPTDLRAASSSLIVPPETCRRDGKQFVHKILEGAFPRFLRTLRCWSVCRSVWDRVLCVRYLVAVQQGFSGGGAQPEGRVEDPETQTVSQILPASFTLQSATQRLLHLCVQARQVAYTRKHFISKPMRRCHDFVFRGYETMNHV